MVKHGHDAVDGYAAPGVLDVAAVAFNQKVDAFILAPHRRIPRLFDVRHQCADGTGGIVVVGGIHPSLGETVATVVVLTDEAGHRDDKGQLVLDGQGIDMRVGIIDIAALVGTPSGLLSVVAIVNDANATIDV